MAKTQRKNPEWQRPERDHVEIEPTAVRGELPDMLTRTMTASGTFDADAMTITAAVASDTPVVRRDARGLYREILDPAGAILPEETPFLDTHNRSTARATLGRAFNFRRDGDAILADLRFSLADDVAPIRQRVADGTLDSFSVGYPVFKWQESTVNGQRVRTAVEWTISEVSLVSQPADHRAKKRSDPMEEDLIEPTAAETRAAVRELVRNAGEPPEVADTYIDSEMTETEIRADLFDRMQARTRNTPRIRVQAPAAEDPATRVRAMEEALHARVAGGTPTDAARPFMGHTLRDFARECVEARGQSTRGMDADQLFRAAHTTSDYPNLLLGVGRRTLMASYTAAASPLKALARQGTRSDFRSGSSLRLGELGALQKVSESGEIKSVSRGEAAESYALDTYGAMYGISRKAQVNDDLGAFNDWANAAGQAAAQTEAALLWNLLSQSNGAGPVMGEDGKRLFHADHGNLLTGAALSETSLSAARLALRTRKGLDGKTVITVTPKFLVVGPELETAAEKLLTAINATTTDDVNPFAGKLTLAVEPRITDDQWFLFADPATVPVLEYSYLSSAPGPQMASREGWETLSVEYRVYLDFGAGAVDWRGAVRNPGA